MVNIALNDDGIVEESQCECGAGQGPTGHCKHVSAVLYGLTCFADSSDVLTELTCTQSQLKVLKQDECAAHREYC